MLRTSTAFSRRSGSAQSKLAAAALAVLLVVLCSTTAFARTEPSLLSTLLVPQKLAPGNEFLRSLPLLPPDTTAQPPVRFIDCKNGERIDGDKCVCPVYYTGEDCSIRQCPNSIGGDGVYSILPINPETQLCDHCDAEQYDGLNCQLCQQDGACAMYGGPGGICSRGVAIRGDNKQYQCKLNSEYFVRMMGDGRNITAEIMLNCSTPDGSAFAGGETGRCSMAIYRIEENREYVDPFFRCDATQCSMKYGEVEKKETEETKVQHIFRVVRTTGQIALVVLSALIALLGLFASALGHRRLTRVTAVLSGAVCLVVFLFILLMIVSMRPLDPEETVIYECKKTKCACAEDPPRRYQPICSESDVLAKKILPAIRNNIRIICLAGTSNCQLTLTDLTLVFNVDCEGGECVDAARFPERPDDKGDDTDASANRRHRILQLLLAGVVMSFVGFVLHWVYLRRRSIERAKEFLLIFDVAPSGDADGSAGGSDDLRPAADEDADEHARLLHGDSQSSLDGADGGAAVHDSGHTVRASVMRRASRLTFDEQTNVTNVRQLTRSALELSVDQLQYALVGSCLADQEDYDSRIILNNINFSVRSGEVLAIMGPSGAGKTTLLDLLSSRAKAGKTTGQVLLNGTPIETTGSSARKYRNIIGYVSQEDTLLPALTVRQTIEYAARLKLPAAFPKRTIRRIVNRMIAVLKLSRCENTLVGNDSGLRGISGGERRRVSIAVELLANPRILFLDEPTSGLDAVSAMRVIEAVVELAKDSPMRRYAPHYFAFKPIVIFSIHQPSFEIYDLFDQILLLSKGVSVYCGRASEAAAVLERRVTEAFGRTRAIPRKADVNNPAEYLMKLEEILDNNVRAELQEEDIRERLHAQQQEQHQGERGNSSVRDSQNPYRRGSAAGDIVVTGEELLQTTASYRIYYANVYQQVGLLTSRAVTCLVGSFHLVVCHALVVACLASLMSFLYQEQALDLPGSLNRAGSCSFLLLVTSFVSLSCLEQLILERKLFVVERENGFYSTFPYLVSKIFVDIIPLRVIPAVVLSSVIYFPMGFRVDSGVHFFWFILVIVLFSICMTLMVMCIGIVTGTFGAAALLSSVFILWNFVFGGALVQAETIPSYLRPFKSASPFFLAFETLMVNELDGQACVFSPTDETGEKSAAEIPIMCVQYLANVGLKPIRFSSDMMQLGIYCFVFTALAWFLLSFCTRLVR